MPVERRTHSSVSKRSERDERTLRRGVARAPRPRASRRIAPLERQGFSFLGRSVSGHGFSRAERKESVEERPFRAEPQVRLLIRERRFVE